MTSPSETLIRCREEFRRVAQHCQRYAILCRSSSLQMACTEELAMAHASASTAKAAVIKVGLEDEANEILAYEYMLDALRNELGMYVALKQDQPGSAWTHLVNAQMAATHAVHAHRVAAHLERDYIPRLHVAEQLLFPKQLFLSAGLVVERAECSICGAVYGDCNHLKRRPYMGQMCACIITKSSVLEVSLVDEPANKHCRVFSFVDDHGVLRCPLSLDVVKPSRDTPSDMPEATSLSP